jgi:hypothetical protein
LFYASTLAGTALNKVLKKEFPKIVDIDELKGSKKKGNFCEDGNFIDPHVEESCRKILNRLEVQRV